MTYYRTLQEDVDRAKEILAKGRANLETFRQDAGLREKDQARFAQLLGGIIYGADTFVAYKLLESFVEAIETVGVDVVKTVLRAVEHGRQLERRDRLDRD